MTDTTMRQPTKIEPGSELHLTVLMAPDHLNLVVGEDRAALLCYGQRVWKAATERATAAERDRCAALADNMTKPNRVVRGRMTPDCKIAAAIRQGDAP